MKTLTEEQAYAAMFYFLRQLFERTKSDDLGGFLGAMSTLQDGSVADPAVLDDWHKAVDYALGDGKPDTLTLS
jgi:hypothetical protein